MSGTDRYFNFLKSERYNTIISYNEEELEDDHAFIQWLFPTTTASAFNSDAPILDIRELRNSSNFADAEYKLFVSLNLILTHLGIFVDDSSIFVYDEDKFKLLNGHNGLRFSRILQSLVYHGCELQARELLNFVLENINLLRPKIKDGRTIWEIRLDQAIIECSSI